MKSRLSPLVSGLLLVSLASPAQAKPTPAEVDKIFREFGPGSPGCSLGVIRAGALVYSKGYGMASLEHGVPLTPQTVLDIGSTSKQITAASILLLAQDGKLSLDDDIRKHIPEMPDYGTPVTLRHLLHHTSGIRDYIVLLLLGGFNLEDVANEEETLAVIARQKALDFKPGDQHGYSNSGYFLLSAVVQRASGKSLREFAQERIFGPLGMASTQYLDDHTRVVPRRAASYVPRQDGGFALAMANWEQTGDGAVQTTVEDLAKWDRNFYDPKVGGPELIKELQVTGVLNSGQAIDYARGLFVNEYRGLRRVSHGGGWAGYRAEMIRFPEERFSVITLCNLGSADPTGLALQVADLYLADRMKPEENMAPPTQVPPAQGAAPAPAAAVDLSPYPGLFFDPVTNQLRRVHIRDGKLFYERAPGDDIELAPLGPDRFLMVGFPIYSEVHFVTAADGRRELHIPQAPNKPVYQAVEPVSLTAGSLDAYLGTFHSEELAVTYTLAVEDGALTVQVANRRPAHPIQPAFADVFRGPGGLLFRFNRDAGKKVTGFTVDSGRARNIGFTRVPGAH